MPLRGDRRELVAPLAHLFRRPKDGEERERMPNKTGEWSALGSCKILVRWATSVMYGPLPGPTQCLSYSLTSPLYER